MEVEENVETEVEGNVVTEVVGGTEMERRK